MNALEAIKVINECAFCRPAGNVSLEEAVTLVEQAITYARANNVPKLLFNGLQLEGIRSPSLPERYFIARRLAAAAQGQVQVALTIHAHLIDPEKFGMQVARNAGMNGEVFDNELTALDWLLLKAPGG
jgi:hypothetical protein